MKRTRVEEQDVSQTSVRRPTPFPTTPDETLLMIFGYVPEPVYTYDSNGNRIVGYQQK